MVYNSGLRLKCAKFQAQQGEEESWLLTENIEKGVSKHDIIMILTTMRRFAERRYRLEPSEREKMAITVKAAITAAAAKENNDSSGASQDSSLGGGSSGQDGGQVRLVNSSPSAAALSGLQISRKLPSGLQISAVAAKPKALPGEEEDEVEDDLDDEDEERFIAR